ncbi:MAG: class I SAM-dependent methyltransferase [Nitrospinae bacterium]|nr:class I SAM-dependent methyltransferase [Nitrospinota bacterium]
MPGKHTKEPQYQALLDILQKEGLAPLGLMTNQVWHDDPRRLVFTLSRYKFVSKMFSGRERVLEVGCADAFASRIVQQEVKNLTAVDFDPIFVKDANDRMTGKWRFTVKTHDILDGPVEGEFDAAYSLDVIEHIPAERENDFVANITRSLTPAGALIIGTPSIQSQAYASPQSMEGHVNCMDHKRLKSLMEKYFHNVFIFSMNDEVIHTGFYPMAHYLFALCAGKKAAS